MEPAKRLLQQIAFSPLGLQSQRQNRLQSQHLHQLNLLPNLFLNQRLNQYLNPRQNLSLNPLPNQHPFLNQCLNQYLNLCQNQLRLRPRISPRLFLHEKYERDAGTIKRRNA